MNKKIIDGIIAIIMLIDDLGQSRVSNQTGGLVPQKGSKNITKDIFNINLDMNGKIMEPRGSPSCTVCAGGTYKPKPIIMETKREYQSRKL